MSGTGVRVAFVISGLQRGGTELRLLEIACQVPPDIAVQVCSTAPEVPLREALIDAGADVTVVPVVRPWRDWKAVRDVRAWLTLKRPHVVNTFDLKGLMIARLIRQSLPCPVALVHHLVDLQHALSPLARTVLWRLLGGASAVVCDAEAIRREVIGGRKLRPSVTVIPNGVDTLRYSPDDKTRRRQRGALGYEDTHLVLGTVANFRPEKNYPFLIDAFAELYRRYPAVRLLAVGGGPDFASINHLVAARGLSSVIHLTGTVDDVRPYLQAMDAFALCSTRDAFSNALLQAMSTAVPVICSRTGDHPLVLAEGDAGLLFASGDRSGFLDAASSILTDAERRTSLALAARNRVVREFSVSVMVDRYVTFFRRLGTPADVPSDRHAPETRAQA